MLKRWLRYIALGAAGLVALTLLVGTAYEWNGRRVAARDFPAPGRLVDIGGRRIQLDCRGTGSPTVVFESGLDMGGSLSWSAVHDSIARTARACAYSRAGIMWSDPHDGPQSAKTVAEDLHATLRAAGERPPFVMVAHSLGGPYAMTYTKYFGSEVAGLVFVDASHPDQFKRLSEVMPRSPAEMMRPIKIISTVGWTGAVRAMAALAGDAPNQPAATTHAIAAYTSTSLAAMLKEADGLDATLAEAGSFRQLGARPLFVLTGARPLAAAERTAMKMSAAQGERYAELWGTMQREEASWSSRSRQQRVTDSGHYIQYDRPDVVIAAVRSVVDSVRRP